MARLGTSRLGASSLAGGVYMAPRPQVAGGSVRVTVIQRYVVVTTKSGA